MLNPRTLVALALSLFVSATSLAATLTVTTTADSGPGSLREALALAVDGDVIEFSVTGTITLTSGQLVVGDSVTIQGPGQESLTISGNDASRVIEILDGEQVAISGLTIANGLISWETGPQGSCCSGEGGVGICNSGNATLTDVSISNNSNFGYRPGAGICNEGDVTLIRVEIVGNTTWSEWDGAAVYNRGSLTMVNSLVSGNRASEGTGAFIANEGSLEIADSQITDNCCYLTNRGNAVFLRTVVSGMTADGRTGIENLDGAELKMIDSEISKISGSGGGGLLNEEGGTVDLVRTTVRSNDGYAATIVNAGAISLISSTITENWVWDTGTISNYATGVMNLINSTVSNNRLGAASAIWNLGELSVTHTTVASNIDVPCDEAPATYCRPAVYNRGKLALGRSALSGVPHWDGATTPACVNEGEVISLGDNIASDETCDLTGPGDTTADPLLGPLADNGGPTLTMALLPGSPAIDAVPIERCTDTDGQPLLVDQRGVPRPQGAACDIGAFEFEAIPVGIDIRPGSDRNPINSFARGVIPVAILGSDSFDVWNVDTQTLAFGPAGAEPRHDLLDLQTFENHLEDVNGDGFTDLVSHYRATDAGIAPGDEDACVTGRTLEGIPFEGCDSIKAFAGRRRLRR